MNKTKICMALLLASFAASAMADNSSGASGSSGQRQRSAQDQQHREPPPQAYEECKGKKEGDAVQITIPSGEKISATCVSSAKGLFARPEHPPGGGQGDQGQQRREPPPQAYEDCKGKKEGDAIQITIASGEKISATCTSSAKGLFARPEHPPR
jgi:hypothetical protein